MSMEEVQTNNFEAASFESLQELMKNGIGYLNNSEQDYSSFNVTASNNQDDDQDYLKYEDYNTGTVKNVKIKRRKNYLY